MKREAYSDLEECLQEMKGQEYEPMPHDVLVEFVARAKTGDVSAKQRIVNAFTKSFKSYVINWNQVNPRLTIQELFQVVRYGILDASTRYDPDRGAEFKTFAHYHVRNQYKIYRISILKIERSAFSGNRKKGSERNVYEENRISFDCVDFDLVSSYECEIYKEDHMRFNVKKLTKFINENERVVLNNYYGMNGNDRLTPEKIAKKLSMHTSRVYQLIKSSNKTMRMTAHMSRTTLADCIG